MANISSLPGPVPLLVAIPTMLGERPRDRIVVVPLGRVDSIEAFSHTLPWRADLRACRRVARELALSAAEQRGVESILIVVFCNSISGGTGDRPYVHLQHLVAAAAHDHNIHLAESYYVAANGWGSYCCDDPLCEISGPRPISELEEFARSMEMEF